MSDFSTKEHIGKFDAIESAKPDEPLFPIQGGDPLGPPTVQFWADEARREARRIMDGERAGFEPSDDREEYQPTVEDRRDADRLLEKATNAEQISWAMRAYQRGDKQPTGTRATYNDHAGPILTEDALDRESKRKALIAMAGQLHGALAMAHAVSEGLGKLGLHPDCAALVDEAVESLKLAAETIEPRRGLERS